MRAEVTKTKGGVEVKLTLTSEEIEKMAREEARQLKTLPKSLVKAIQELQSRAEKGGATLKAKL
jgi:glutamine synthetase